jgi:hypothetical protein
MCVPAGIWKMDEPVGVGVWRKKDRNGNWITEKSEFDIDASKKRADHLDHFLKLPSFQQRYELEVKARDSVRDARKCAGTKPAAAQLVCFLALDSFGRRRRSCGVQGTGGGGSRSGAQQSIVFRWTTMTHRTFMRSSTDALSSADNKGFAQFLLSS